MLKQRVLSAMVAIPIVCSLIVLASLSVYAVLLAALIIWASWEWALLVKLSKMAHWGMMGLQGILLVLLFVSGFERGNTPALSSWICHISLVFWLIVLGLVFNFERFQLYAQSSFLKSLQMNPHYGLQLGAIGVGVALLYPLAAGLWQLKVAGQESLVLFVLSLIWLADSAAYFGGKAFGRHKLAPRLSPGKTWEGLFSSVLAGIILSILVGYLTGFWSVFGLIFIGFIIVLVSALGDLFESGIKRLVGVKDSGRGLPGHGGVLDRIDSLTAAVPVFVVLHPVFLGLL